MQPIRRRSFLQWIGAAFAAVVTRSAPGVASATPQKMSGPNASPLLRTEHFEAGHITLEAAESEPLGEMLRNLHERRNHDCANHPGEVAPHFDYLTGWINQVTGELQSRGYPVEVSIRCI